MTDLRLCKPCGVATTESFCWMCGRETRQWGKSIVGWRYNPDRVGEVWLLTSRGTTVTLGPVEECEGYV